MVSANKLASLLAAHLRDPQCSWSMGSYGAVAEFFQEFGEAIGSGHIDELFRVTPRGGIRIEPRNDLCVVTHEKKNGDHGHAQQHIVFCLPADESRMSGAKVLTELGHDSAALRDNDRDAVLFNLGVSSLGTGCNQLDFCIRTDDRELIEFLREHCGSDIFEHSSPVYSRLLLSQPHRVVITRLGRIEVYQAIGGEHTDGKTPDGPHTHLLPDLLSLNRTHPADLPIEDGWVPCAILYAGTIGSDRVGFRSVNRA